MKIWGIWQHLPINILLRPCRKICKFTHLSWYDFWFPSTIRRGIFHGIRTQPSISGNSLLVLPWSTWKDTVVRMQLFSVRSGAYSPTQPKGSNIFWRSGKYPYQLWIRLLLGWSKSSGIITMVGENIVRVVTGWPPQDAPVAVRSISSSSIFYADSTWKYI